MPLLKLYTNLSKEKLPESFMPELVEEISKIIDKDKNHFNWILETDKCMSKVSNRFLKSKWVILKQPVLNFVNLRGHVKVFWDKPDFAFTT